MGDPVRGTERRRARTGVTVTGSGAAAAAVDQVTVTLGVSVTRADAGEAFQAAAHTATRVLAILADDGVDSRSVRTADLTLGPQLEWRDNREFLVGYQAGQRLIIHLIGLAGVDRMLSDLAVRGGDGLRIENVSLTPSNPAAAMREARAAAFADALAKASQLADLGGHMLGELNWIDERNDQPVAVALYGQRSPRESAKMPIAAGDALVGVSVTAQWSFAPDGG